MATISAALTLAVTLLATGCVVSRPGATSPTPAALPAATVVPSQRIVEYPHGRWVLHGDGSPVSPYGWVWEPTAPPPPLAR